MRSVPRRGILRDDIRIGLRITNFRGRLIIAFVVDENARQVVVLGVYHASQNYEATLRAADA